jgi:tyrosyl-tRNA synthetase
VTGILDDLEARGLVHHVTEGLPARLAAGPVTLYYGCDPTAPSLHVGNLIGLLILRRFREAGHRPIALAGGATGMIGDPSGRSEERNLLDEATLATNVAAIGEQMARILDPDGDGGAALVDNRAWTEDLTLIEFLRSVGRHVTVSQMLARESVRARLQSEHGISFTEFTYMLLQANDYLWLHDHEGCELQIGGSDQWGNILSGVDLVRRTRGREVHGLCWPLLTAADGSKLGKTTGARTWLDPTMTSPYAFFQHWMAVEDADVPRMLAQFTLLPMAEVREAAAAHAEAPQRREGQRRLAREVTALVHGVPSARAAEEAAAVLFGASPAGASVAALEAVAGEVPVVRLQPGEDLAAGIELQRLLVRAGLASSHGEARRHIEQGGLSVNGARATLGDSVTADDLLQGRWVLLRRGKRDWAVLDASGG